MEPVPAPGDLRFSLTTLFGRNFEGGHFSREGNAADGTLVAVPLHRHEVSLDITRVELELRYTVAPAWDLVARIPWEEKSQDASITLVDPASDAERAAMIQNMNLHHRTATYRGLGDLMFLARRRGERFRLAFGATAPTGRTVENPYALGDRELEHVHIQFGTGTVDPLVEVGWLAPLGERLSARVHAGGRFPFYENSRGFRAPVEVSAGASLTRFIGERWHVRAEASAYSQRYGYWDGVRDENTGLFATAATIGGGVLVRGVQAHADVRVPISQRTLNEGDAFEQGPTVIVSMSAKLR